MTIVCWNPTPNRAESPFKIQILILSVASGTFGHRRSSAWREGPRLAWPIQSCLEWFNIQWAVGKAHHSLMISANKMPGISHRSVNLYKPAWNLHRRLSTERFDSVCIVGTPGSWDDHPRLRTCTPRKSHPWTASLTSAPSIPVSLRSGCTKFFHAFWHSFSWFHQHQCYSPQEVWAAEEGGRKQPCKGVRSSMYSVKYLFGNWSRC